MLLAFERDDFPEPTIRRNTDGTETLTFSRGKKVMMVLLIPAESGMSVSSYKSDKCGGIHVSCLDNDVLDFDEVVEGQNSFDTLRLAAEWLVGKHEF